MNLRKDHYRVPPEGRRRPPSRPSGNGCEKKRTEAAVGGEGGRWRLRAAGLADARLPPSRNARGNPQRNASAGGGSPGESRGRGETASGGPPPLRHPRGEPARRQAEPGTARAPPPFTRGGGGGSEGLEASSPGAPSRGGRPAERPDARGPGGGGAGPPVRRRRTPPLRSAKTCRVPPWRQRRNLPRKRTKSKTLSGGSLGSRVDEERS